MKAFKILLSACLLIFFYSSCKKGPKIISTPIEQGVRTDIKSAKTIFSDEDSPEPFDNAMQGEELHLVETLEVIGADRYTYVKVKEGDKEFWVATGKREMDEGKLYFFKKGLVKSNFRSEELDKTFDKLHLVSNLVPADHGGSKIQKIDNTATISPQGKSGDEIREEGSISIAEIVNNPNKYEHKEVQITGKCTKVNYNIMGRNWIHLKDGSKDDFDLVLTSNDKVTVNQQVTMKGVVHLGVDFGAGYVYDIIIEDAELVN